MIGTKELVAWLPTLLGLGPDDLVVYPDDRLPDLRGWCPDRWLSLDRLR